MSPSLVESLRSVTTQHVLVLLIAAIATACGSKPASVEPTTGSRPTPASEGQALYDRYCALCHGIDGHSATDTNSSNLNSQGLLTIVNDQYLFDSIALGRPGANSREQPGTKMPVFSAELGGPLSDHQIALIVEYVRGWQTQSSVVLAPYEARGDPEAGAQVYADNCSECHGVSGWSDTAPSLAGSTFQSTATDAFARHVIQEGLPGTDMLGFDLTPEQLGDVISFVRALATEEARTDGSMEE